MPLPAPARSLRAIAQDYQLPSEGRALGQLLNHLKRQGALSQAESAVLADLTQLLNAAVHGADVDLGGVEWAMEVGPRLLAGLDEKRMDKKVLEEVPIHGREVTTTRGTWKIAVESARQEAETTLRHLTLQLIGAQNYELNLVIPVESIRVNHRMGECDWIIEEIKCYLEQPKVPVTGKLRLS